MKLRTLLGAALALWALGCGDDSGSGGAASTSTASTGDTSSSSSAASTSASTSTTSTASSSSTGGLSCDPAQPGPETLQLVPFTTDIPMPIAMAPHPTNPSRLFIAERSGVIHVVDDGVVLPQPFLDLSALVSCCDEDRGFLDLEFHPDYEDNGLFYVHYTELGSPVDSTSILAEYRRSMDDPDVADPTPVREIMAIDQDTVWHFGGTITFGPDGMLYYSRGDGGGAGDPENDAQNPQSRYGKVMRIDVDTFPTPPPGNMPGAEPFVWDMGLRNVWRMSFDRCTGDLYLGDVGQNSIEEISVHRASDGHLNYGWHMYEGSSCFAPPCDPTGMTMPVIELDHQAGFCAVIGGYVYRGSLLPGHRGRYFYGDICSKRIRSFVLDATGSATDLVDHSQDLETANFLGDYTFGSFGEDLNGELYVLDMDGVVYRIEAD